MLTAETNIKQEKERYEESEPVPIRSIESTINKQTSCIGENWNESPSHAHENGSGHNY